jgi:hypothetical protein
MRPGAGYGGMDAAISRLFHARIEIDRARIASYRATLGSEDSELIFLAMLGISSRRRRLSGIPARYS